ncbi:sigma-54-dependent Fis family transcriptional regulator [Thauera sp. CAU 1555]|uniref:Sigma-54-dependent Fis family transcriptional regulator n=1 Tax=Thauera sedimentorum TaxID=2767595 RepID=A0ABR9B9L1_9RHOO|nr:sigma 54-interacting transcriptional regulator [Thauera sedimentorum]MBC9071720.1 sigma-54-dependent Fis family transcriptional regulator [Thauera sedimentorum]MBD8502639.1 sigma-54-dependent Fis family transcriptional regulator [Thauera sedimentorum]
MNPALPRDPPGRELLASWERSKAYGLTADQPLPDATLARVALDERLEANARLLTFSRPVLENLYRQIGSPASTVLLADQEGMILSAVGDTAFLDRAARVALGPGACWSEAEKGTNAIGTALQAGRTVAVLGEEHFLRRNHFLNCVATPILAPGGGVLGILDVSTDARADISHADALLRTTAELIEHQLIQSLDDGFMILRFHHRAELLGSPLEALMVFDEDGCLIASNRAARSLLALDPAHPVAFSDDCFATPWPGLVGWAALQQNTPFPLRSLRGHTYVSRATLAQRRPRMASRPIVKDSARLSQLDAMRLGDARLAAVLDHVAGTARERTPLLIEGETGSGKTHLARAVHHDHDGADVPLVTLDCPTLATGEAGRREATAAIAQAAGGTLLLKEIGALPVALQAMLVRRSADTDGARLVATTTTPVHDLEARQAFARADFDAHRGSTVTIPPLRARSDFDALVRLFVRESSTERNIYVCPDALARLRQHAWPGNLRELRNQLRLILALMGDEANQLCPEDIPPELFDEDAPGKG